MGPEPVRAVRAREEEAVEGSEGVDFAAAVHSFWERDFGQGSGYFSRVQFPTQSANTSIFGIMLIDGMQVLN
jgi:hypothetical protein